MTKKKTLEDFLGEAKQVHGDRYDYSNTVYTSTKTHCKFICRVHGEFSQAPYEHLHSLGCAKCAQAIGGAARKVSVSSFKSKASEVHNGYYTYDQVREFKSSRDKVSITCPVHGEFRQGVTSHMAGNGCAKCAIARQVATQTFTQAEVLSKFAAAHGDRYDYSKAVYLATYSKVVILCPDHGEFEQSPQNHWSGQGCRKCHNARTSKRLTKDTAEFTARATEVHAGAYDYSETVYVGSKTPVKITCSQGHVFHQRPNDHLTGHGCPSCTGTGDSAPEYQIYSFIQSLGIDCELGNRKILNGKEIDILHNDLGIEFNGLYWHSESAGKVPTYHRDKTLQAKEQGVKLIHIFEDEWLYKSDIVKARLSAKFGKSEKTAARKLQLREVGWKAARDFYEKTHIQGAGQAGKSLGLYTGDTLMACLTVGKRRDVYELLRYASVGIVVGGFSRLFTAFIRQNTQVDRLISYADLRWGEGAVYGSQGFKRLSDTSPGYFWCKKLVRYSRQKFQKHKLAGILSKFDADKTEAQNMKDNGYYKIYDCGHAKWEWVR